MDFPIVMTCKILIGYGFMAWETWPGFHRGGQLIPPAIRYESQTAKLIRFPIIFYLQSDRGKLISPSLFSGPDFLGNGEPLIVFVRQGAIGIHLHALEKEIARLEESGDDDEAVKKRLRGLGYIS